MLAKLALAALIGAVMGVVAATGGAPWPGSTVTQTTLGARTVASVEAAWHALRQRRAP
ncbi:MAG TPA: hypothetical protein VFP65_01805 [Anaeromyxobacteraceae bacterium]|nr:hypothetical protein [Anaeromyxobacteraceae bacterium]